MTLAINPRQTVQVQRFEVLRNQDELQFRELNPVDGDWVPDLPLAELALTASAGVNVMSFQIADDFDAAFPSNPVQWIAPELRTNQGRYVPEPQPPGMEIQRDSDKRCSIWIRNLNYGPDREEHAFLLLVLGTDGQVYASKDPSVYNEPDQGTDP